MRYYKATEQVDLPYITFNLVADDAEHLTELGLDADTLVVTEDQLFNDQDPNYISFEFGICHKKISSGGALIDRPGTEIDAQESETLRLQKIAKTEELEVAINTSLFVFDGEEFPLTPSSREVYKIVLDSPAGDIDIQSVDGVYTLTDANRATFKTAYYDKLLALKEGKLEAAIV